MTQRISLAVLIILVLAAGCSRRKAGEENGPSGSAALTVRAQAADGSSVLAVIAGIEQQLDRIESFNAAGPGLGQQTFEFDLGSAAMVGPESAKITVVVFSDFQCSHCRTFAGLARELRSRHPDDLRIAFVNYPLNNECNPDIAVPMNAKACLFAEAALAAGEQGKFIEMHDWLFEHQGDADLASILEFAASQGLDPAELQQALESHRFRGRVLEPAGQLHATGARGVPAVFINGRMVERPRWSDAGATLAFFDQLLGRETQRAAPAHDAPGSLPAAQVILADGVRLEDRLKEIEDRLSGLEAPQRRAGREVTRAPSADQEFKFRTEGRPALGPENAPVQAVLFYDLLVPETKTALELIAKLHNRFPAELRIVFKVLPTRRDPFSVEVHNAALAAAEQGKFWEVVTGLAQPAGTLTPEMIREELVRAGINMETYSQPETQRKLRQLLAEDQADSRRARISSAPALFLNGKYQPRLTYEPLADEINKLTGGNQ